MSKTLTKGKKAKTSKKKVNARVTDSKVATLVTYDPLAKENLKVEKFQFGRFNFVRVEAEDGVKAIGGSRCSELDKYNEEKGNQIAYGRAIRSLYNKRSGKQNRFWYLG